MGVLQVLVFSLLITVAFEPVIAILTGEQQDTIKSYFYDGYKYGEIVSLLAIYHGIHICVRTLKSYLKKMSLKRRCQESDRNSIIQAIRDEMQGSGQCIGYRAMWRRLNFDHELNVKQETVLRLMWMLDREGMEKRKAKRLKHRKYNGLGPNYILHMDGYDKIKRYGFAIHGAIDGFSREVLWLRVYRSNNDPQIIAQYYLDFLEESGFCPVRIRSDYGTENPKTRAIHLYLWDDVIEAEQCNTEMFFLYGKSTSNQRIESWWSILR